MAGARLGIKNFSLLASHVLVPPAVSMLMSSPVNRVQGLIAPGHVCAIVGTSQYEEFAKEFHIPIVVGGFEPVDLLEAIVMLTAQLEEGRAELENQYSRSVSAAGNHSRAAACGGCFRGLRSEVARPWTGAKERPEDARRFSATTMLRRSSICRTSPSTNRRSASAREILRGLKRPTDCPAFGY